jgi:hypothetical protein
LPTSGLTGSISEANGGTGTTTGYYGFKNRIINGAMVIDQRNAGASINNTNTGTQFSVDRWAVYGDQISKFSLQQNAGSVTPPAGFTYYLGMTSSSAYTVGAAEQFKVYQNIEGYNMADLGWGAAGASAVTLSFWARSSLTGTFGGSLINNSNNRSYPFSYAISSANTWEYKTVTIAGDTTGTWGTTNGTGVAVQFSMGTGSSKSGTAGAWAASNLVSVTGAVSVVGTSGATLYLAGVQLEKGSTATSFDYRPYGTELALCQRYYFKTATSSTGGRLGAGHAATTSTAYMMFNLPVPMRIPPTALEQSGNAAHYGVNYLATGILCSIVPSFVEAASNTVTTTYFTIGSGLFTAGHGVEGGTASSSGFLAWSAEL